MPSPDVLVAAGLGAAIVVLLGARLTRKPRASATVANSTSPDPISAFTPREHSERPRPRMWPVLALVPCLIAVAAGALESSRRSDEVATRVVSRSPGPFLVTIEETPPPEASPEAAAESASPSPSALQSQAAARPTPRRTATPGVRAAPTATARATATSKAGPAISGTGTCSGGKAQVNVTVTARPGTTLSSLKITFDGSVLKQPGVSGQPKFNGSFGRTASAGKHSFTASATGSNGMSSSSNFAVTC
ncbi:MAG TPA: hypothetical protein VNE62_01625 [Actinomycetota bacterium]|nr:hypothetical protein [Actinomycetota bacterium]